MYVCMSILIAKHKPRGLDMDFYSKGEIKNLLRLNIGREAILRAEKEGRIPSAKRVKKGNINVRKWAISDIPEIGKKYGRFNKPTIQRIISFYTGKGGVLKSTLAFNFGRTLALNGIKTLLIGLDIQESITTLCLNSPKYENIEDIKPIFGLYDLFKNTSLNKIIRPTDIPTLDILPENFELNILEKELRNKIQREKIFKRKLVPLLSNYDIIIFDNSPNWNLLIENSLVASNIVITPISCEIGTYQALEKNLKTLIEFKNEMEITWDDYIMIPTLLENNKISKQILGAFLAEYGEQITNGTIRRTVKGQESMALNQSIFEYSPNSELANDYDSLFLEIWSRINKTVNQ